MPVTSPLPTVEWNSAKESFVPLLTCFQSKLFSPKKLAYYWLAYLALVVIFTSTFQFRCPMFVDGSCLLHLWFLYLLCSLLALRLWRHTRLLVRKRHTGNFRGKIIAAWFGWLWGNIYIYIYISIGVRFSGTHISGQMYVLDNSSVAIQMDEIRTYDTSQLLDNKHKQ